MLKQVQHDDCMRNSCYNIAINNTQNPINHQNNIVCPECDTALPLPDNIILGKILECSACGTTSEIVELNPLKLSPLEEEK